MIQYTPVSKKDFAKAEALVLRAQKPEQLIRWYRDSLMWKEAIVFTKEHLPAKLAELNDEYDRFVSAKPDAGQEEYLSTARMFEQQRDYDKAIDMYLKMTSDVTSDSVVLEEAWSRAVELAIKFAPSRCDAVVHVVCERLVVLKQYAKAARLYISIDARREAVDLFMRVDQWEEARKAAGGDRQLLDYVESAHIRFMKSSGKADDLSSMDLGAALDMYVTRNEWEKCMEKATSTKQREIVDKYLMMWVATLVREKKFDDAVKQLGRFGLCANVQYLDLYEKLIKGALKTYTKESVKHIRQILFKLVRICGEWLAAYDAVLTLLPIPDRPLILTCRWCFQCNLRGIYSSHTFLLCVISAMQRRSCKRLLRIRLFRCFAMPMYFQQTGFSLKLAK